MSKITYANKETGGGPVTGVVIAGDMNEIKTSVNKLYDDGGGIYLAYKATFTQTGTDTPVATIQFNSLGYVPALNQGGTGITQILLTGTIDAAKVDVRLGKKTSSAKHLDYTYYLTSSNTVINIKTRNLITDAYENDMLVDTPIEIRIYE